MKQKANPEFDSQETFVELRDPAELVMCVILAAAFAGLGKYCWSPLSAAGNLRLFVNVESFFFSISLLASIIGFRPYISPSSLQVSSRGLKYRGPFWPRRKTVNWDQVFRLYVSPELIVVLYHPRLHSKAVWPLVIQSVYLADHEQVSRSVLAYSPVPAVMLSGPSWLSRLVMITAFVFVVVWILETWLQSG